MKGGNLVHEREKESITLGQILVVPLVPVGPLGVTQKS